MAWDMGSWLVFVRSIQLLGTLVCAACNGSLLAYITVSNLGTSQNMVVLEWIISVIFCYTGLNLLILHTRGRSRRPGWVVAFIVADLISVGALVAIITLLSRAGVPSNCAGLTTSDPESSPFSRRSDRPYPAYTTGSESSPHADYTTTRFSDGSPGQKGALDKYCVLERAYYFIAVAILYSYAATVCLGILRICEGKYTANARVLRAMDLHHGSSDHSGYELLSKLEERRLKTLSASASTSASPRIPPPAPPSEGITSPRQSIRSAAHPSHITQRIAPPPLHQQQPVSPLSVHSALSPPLSTSTMVGVPPTMRSPSSPPPPPGLGIASDDAEERLAVAAMVTDGARFDGGYRPGMSTLPPYSPTSPVGQGSPVVGGPLGDYGGKGGAL